MIRKFLFTILLILLLITNCFAATELDYMESYTTDALAQSNYPSSDAGADPNTVLLANLDGADGATSFTAETGQVATFVGTAQLDTAQFKFGTASLLLDGNSDYITFPDSTNWYFYDGDFTVDGQFRLADNTIAQYITGQFVDTSNFWGIYWDTGILRLYGSFSGTVKFNYSATMPLSANTPYHMAVVRSGSTCYMFVDGVSKSVTETVAFAASADLADTLQIGEYHTGGNYFNGWIDEFRITKGVARWTADFSAPIRAYDLDKLICYSESTITNQGSYSLNGFAAHTGSLNDTLTRTVSPTINLTDQTSWKLYIYSANRTGSNIKIGIRDSGGTTTEVTPNITSTGAWQLVDTDISAVSNANKDAIDRIIVTPTNADNDNTFYIDNMFGEIPAAAPTGQLIWIN